ncbi:hypothetical protein EXD76_08535 [BEV proteobacterium]|nr:hypothetical protein [Candidatus Symbiopectobacterium sp. Chty_BC]
MQLGLMRKLYTSGDKHFLPKLAWKNSIILYYSTIALSIMFGLRGSSISIATACTSGVHNIGHAACIIAYNDADIMLVCGAEKSQYASGRWWV